jgi:small conductance mechanosensitive channel
MEQGSHRNGRRERMEGFVEKFQEALASYGPSVVGAAVILLVGWWPTSLATRLTRRLMTRGEVDPTLTAFLTNLMYMLLMVLVVISAIGRLGVNTTSFAAVIAAGALAIGFALQGSLANFAAGVMLIFFRPFKTGDFIEAGGVAGIVEEVQVFASKIRTPDNKQIVVPNSAITGGAITNYSAKETRRVDLVFGIAYEDDLVRAKNILNTILADDDRVLADPTPTVGVLELGDSSVNFAVRPWVSMADYWPVYFDLTERVKLEFDRQGISIPFPQRDVHVKPAA